MRTKLDMLEVCRLTAPALAFTSLRTAGKASAATFTALPTWMAKGFMLSSVVSLEAVAAVAAVGAVGAAAPLVSNFSGDSFCLVFVAGLPFGLLLFFC